MPRFRRPRQRKRRNMLRSLRWEFKRRQGAIDRGCCSVDDDILYYPEVDLVLDSRKSWCEWKDDEEQEREPEPPPPPLDPEEDMERALKSVRDHLDDLQTPVRVIERVEGYLMLGFTFAGEPCVAQLSVSRKGDPGKPDVAMLPRLLELAGRCGAHPIQVHAELRFSGDFSFADLSGLPEFIDSIHRDPDRWKRHMLGNVPARTWLERAGRVSEIGFRVVRDGWPYLLVDGHPLELPKVNCWQREDPPLDPWELCESVTKNNECLLFTCECSERECGAIYGGVLVAHDRGLTVWRCPDQPDVPLVVFDRRQYRKAILALAKRLIRHAPKGSGLNWTMGGSPRDLYRAMNRARAKWAL